MLDLKAVIKFSDMPEEMQQYAIDCAIQAHKMYNNTEGVRYILKSIM